MSIRIFLKAFLPITAFALSGCYSMQGSERILTSDGLLYGDMPSNAIFVRDFERAHEIRLEGAAVPQAEIDNLLGSGFQHIYSYCDGYFDTMGQNQRRSSILRDA